MPPKRAPVEDVDGGDCDEVVPGAVDEEVARVVASDGDQLGEVEAVAVAHRCRQHVDALASRRVRLWWVQSSKQPAEQRVLVT